MCSLRASKSELLFNVYQPDEGMYVCMYVCIFLFHFNTSVKLMPSDQNPSEFELIIKNGVKMSYKTSCVINTNPTFDVAKGTFRVKTKLISCGICCFFFLNCCFSRPIFDVLIKSLFRPFNCFTSYCEDAP